MRSKRNPVRPCLEGLEQRWVPATIRLVSGSLLISNQTGPLTVTATATAGKFTVDDNGKIVTVSGVGKMIQITGTNAANTINLDFTAKTFGGNVLVNSGNGADTITLTGNIGGSMTVLGGLGNDTFDVLATSKVGGSLTYTNTNGADTVTLTGDLTVGTTLSVLGVSLFDNVGGLKVGGAASISATLSTANKLTANFTGATSVGGSLTVTGGSLDDAVNVTGTFDVFGNATVQLGGGNNVFALTPAGGTGVNGSLFYRGNGGDDIVTLTGANVDGNASFDLGAGINDYLDDATTTIGGNLSITGGSDDNGVDISSTIAGDLRLALGNGINATLVNSVPGGTLSYRGGNGDDTLVLDAAAGFYLVDLLFGTGINLLDIGPSGGTLTVNGYIVGSGGANTFIQGANVTLLPTLIMVNFP